MRDFVFKNRGNLLLPSAFAILILGKPSIYSFIIGTVVLLIGEAIRIWGVGYAGVTTRSDKVEAPLLVTAGPYSYIRNPLYAGNFLIGLGFCIMACGAVNVYLKVFMTIFFLFSYIFVYGTIIPLEENFLKEKFGEVYIKYLASVPRIIPFKKAYEYKEGTFSWEPVKKGEIHTFIYLGIAFIIFALRAFGLF